MLCKNVKARQNVEKQATDPHKNNEDLHCKLVDQIVVLAKDAIHLVHSRCGTESLCRRWMKSQAVKAFQQRLDIERAFGKLGWCRLLDAPLQARYLAT
jgi:hypothetical protein